MFLEQYLERFSGQEDEEERLANFNKYVNRKIQNLKNTRKRRIVKNQIE